MSIKRCMVYQVYCDGCPAPGPSAPNRGEAAHEAAAVGWTHLGDPLKEDTAWHCPVCRKASRMAPRCRRRN